MIKQLIFFLCFATLAFGKIYTGPSYIKEIERNFDQFADEVARKNKLTLIGSCIGTELIPQDEKRMAFCMSFKSNKNLTIDQARLLVKNIIGAYIPHLYSNIDWQKYIAYHKVDANPSLKWICFKISFWDENIDPQKPPNIAKIIVSDEKIRFYYSDLSGALIEPPVVEALQQ